MHQWSCGGDTNQRWRINPINDSFPIQLFNKNNSRCMAVKDSSNADGGPIVQVACTGADNGQFYVRKAPGGSGTKFPNGMGWDYTLESSIVSCDGTQQPPLTAVGTRRVHHTA